jgi:tetratricopeptide (TPR) repeat protein
MEATGSESNASAARTFLGLPLRTVGILLALSCAGYLFLPAKPFFADSLRAIVENAAVQEKPLLGLFAVDFWGIPFRSEAATGSYRPLVSLSYALQARIFGNHVQLFHLVDMALHAAAVLFVAAISLLWSRRASWVIPTAALFAVHPIVSEAVCSLIGRADLMAGLLCLAALWVHLRGALGTDPTPRVGWVVSLLGATLLCKEYAVAFPFVWVVLDLVLDRTGRVVDAHRKARTRVWIGSFALLGAYLLTRYLLIGSLGGVPMLAVGDHPLFDQPLTVRTGTGLGLYLTAVRLLLCPWPMSYYYGTGTIPIATGLISGRTLAALLVILLAAVWGAGELKRRRNPWPLILIAGLVLTLGPTLNIVSIAGVLFAERYLYLPTALLALALGSWAMQFTGARERVVRGVATALIIVGVIVTAIRADLWRSSETLAQSALRADPGNAQAWCDIGLAAGASGRIEEARDALAKSLEIEPRRPLVWTNYARALSQLAATKELAPNERRTQFAAAADAWRKALDLSPPDLPPLWRGLGEAELGAKRPIEAVQALTRAHGLDPQNEETRLMLANALLQAAQQQFTLGQLADAVQQAERAIELTSLPPEGYFLAGLVFARAGKRADADRAFGQAEQGDPEILNKRFQRAVESSNANQHAQAARLFEEIVLARPSSVSTMFNLGRELFMSEQWDQAALWLERGLAVKPDTSAARELLAEARRRRDKQ